MNSSVQIKEENGDEMTAMISNTKTQQQHLSKCLKIMQIKMKLEDEKTDILKSCDCQGDCDICQSKDDDEKATFPLVIFNEAEGDQTEFYPQEWEVYEGAEECTNDATTGNESQVNFEQNDSREALPIIEQANSEPSNATICENDEANGCTITELKEEIQEETRQLPGNVSPSPMITLRRSTRKMAYLVDYAETDPEAETDSSTEKEELYKPKRNRGTTYTQWCLPRKTVKCRQCGKKFACQRSLNCHRLTVHQQGLPFVCSFAGCLKAFKDRHDLSRHAIKHSGLRIFKCGHCQWAFTDKSGLRRHRKVHTGELVYACTDCGWAFTQEGHLIRHRQIRHG